MAFKNAGPKSNLTLRVSLCFEVLKKDNECKAINNFKTYRQSFHGMNCPFSKPWGEVFACAPHDIIFFLARGAISAGMVTIKF